MRRLSLRFPTFRPGRALRLLAAIALVASVAAPAAAQPLDAIEYYHQQFDHYFVTANPVEIGKLDAGQFAGWARTGERIRVHPSGTALQGILPVCRFYGRPEAGLDSHFYSASAAECAEVAQKFPASWLLEANDVFRVALPHPATGACPAGMVSVFRAWNNRADSNHRYTTNPATQAAMVAKGYVAEGYGPPGNPVAMCAVDPAAPAVPACTLSASSVSPTVGTNVTLTASCTGAPTSYAWTGCTSTASTCTATSAVAGTVIYSVVASNAAGTSPSASVAVTWTSGPPPAPVPACVLSVTANHQPPVVGDLALITAACSNSPTNFTWTGPCGANTTRCYAFVTAPGTRTYQLVAANAAGSSAPVSVSVDWQSSAPPAPGSCGAFPSGLQTNLGYASTALFSTWYTEEPAFAWNGVWTVRFSVPPVVVSTATGRVIMSEFNGPPTQREVTISTVACDFRPTDPTGVNGPVARATGSAPGIFFAVATPQLGLPRLLPGQTYYVSARNWSVESGTITCPASPGRCDAQIELQLPR